MSPKVVYKIYALLRRKQNIMTMSLEEIRARLNAHQEENSTEDLLDKIRTRRRTEEEQRAHSRLVKEENTRRIQFIAGIIEIAIEEAAELKNGMYTDDLSHEYLIELILKRWDAYTCNKE